MSTPYKRTGQKWERYRVACLVGQDKSVALIKVPRPGYIQPRGLR